MLESIINAYLACALWSSSDDSGEPLNSAYNTDDLAPDTLAHAHEDIGDFLGLLQREGVQWSTHWTPAQFGHDFWLTRNGHGAGFWDRYGVNNEEGHALGQRLTDWCKTYSSIDLYIGDDGKVYQA